MKSYYVQVQNNVIPKCITQNIKYKTVYQFCPLLQETKSNKKEENKCVLK